MYTIDVQGTRNRFDDLKSLMAKATPLRSGDCLSGVAAYSAVERVAAQMRLADLPLATFLDGPLISWDIPRLCRGGSRSLTYPAVRAPAIHCH